jgi:hypothetical protein
VVFQLQKMQPAMYSLHRHPGGHVTPIHEVTADLLSPLLHRNEFAVNGFTE